MIFGLFHYRDGNHYCLCNCLFPSPKCGCWPLPYEPAFVPANLSYVNNLLNDRPKVHGLEHFLRHLSCVLNRNCENNSSNDHPKVHGFMHYVKHLNDGRTICARFLSCFRVHPYHAHEWL